MRDGGTRRGTAGARAALALLALSLWPVPAEAQKPASSPDLIEADVRYFAGDRLEGRGLGSPGLDEALRAVAQRFADLGLDPLRPELPEGADPLDGYLQPFAPPALPPTANVVGLLAGPAERTPRAVVLGAHLDHLGRDAGLAGDQIFNGAADNASGVAALLAVAELLVRQPAGERDRTVVFAVFSGEESGLLGSRHYVEHPAVPNEEVLAMVNLDTIGRLTRRELYILGTATAQEFAALLAGLNQAPGFALILRGEGATGSDQASFFERGIPVLHFFTGPHEDYHRVSDEAGRVNVAGVAAIADYVAELMRYLRYRDRPLTFVGAAPEEQRKVAALAASRPERRVSLGFMPDFAQEHGGVKVGMVSPGGAAARAGLTAGDVVVAIDGETIDTLVDYTAALRAHAPGERVRVALLRGTDRLEVEVEVQERK
jgi:hypothetical protein